MKEWKEAEIVKLEIKSTREIETDVEACDNWDTGAWGIEENSGPVGQVNYYHGNGNGGGNGG